MSEQFKLTKADQNKWQQNTLRFLAPLFLVYVVQLIATFSDNSNIVELLDFTPTNVTIGAMVLYVLNSAYDLIIKYTSTT